MILLRLSSNALNFSVVVRWRLVFQEHLDRMHPIIHWFLLQLICYLHISFAYYFTGLCCLDRRLG
jgi:hypothetical protein